MLQALWTPVAGTAAGLTWITVPLEGNVRLTDRWALSGTLHYRYEDYFTSASPFNAYHEVFLLAGPRLSLSGTGLEGAYLSAQAGLGYSVSPAPYSAVWLSLQPKVGYSWVFGKPGFYLGLGAGLLVTIPLSENPTGDLTTIGYLVHRFFPILDVSVGMAF